MIFLNLIKALCSLWAVDATCHGAEMEIEELFRAWC